jgi:methyltransferase family protein
MDTTLPFRRPRQASPRMPRHEVVQGLLALFEAPRYLEIGVAKGVTFHAVRAAEKVAVDPRFGFDVGAAQAANREARYFEVTSDHYFGQIVAPDERFDLVYLDGLHTAEQTLRDLLNALSYLEPVGIVVIDDVKPVTALAAIPERATFARVRDYLGSRDRAWMGDVYKVVYFVDTFLQQLSYRTVAENHGQAVVWQQRRGQVRPRTIQEVGTQSFEQLVTDLDTLRITPYEEILATIRAEQTG